MSLKKPDAGSIMEVARSMKPLLPKVERPEVSARVAALVGTLRDREGEHAGLAHTMHKSLVEQMSAFQKSLADDEEIGIALASFGTNITISVRSFGFRHPHLMIFEGVGPDGKHVTLLQHSSQVSLLLKSVKVSDRKPYRIGFKLAIGDDGTDANGEPQ